MLKLENLLKLHKAILGLMSLSEMKVALLPTVLIPALVIKSASVEHLDVASMDISSVSTIEISSTATNDSFEEADPLQLEFDRDDEQPDFASSEDLESSNFVNKESVNSKKYAVEADDNAVTPYRRNPSRASRYGRSRQSSSSSSLGYSNTSRSSSKLSSKSSSSRSPSSSTTPSPVAAPSDDIKTPDSQTTPVIGSVNNNTREPDSTEVEDTDSSPGSDSGSSSPADVAPVATDFSESLVEDVESTLLLVYTDADLDFAESCSIVVDGNLTETTACSCTAGVCGVGVTGVSNFNGSASFSFTVTAGDLTSNSAQASVAVSSVDDAPVADAISPAAFNEEVESAITLSYSEIESDLATACAITPDANVTETTACTCDGAGVCTVGVTGVTDFNGAASFAYTVTANTLVSNSALASLTINNVDDAPVANAISPAAFNEEVESVITLSYSDADSDLATVCAITPDANITETQACACDGAGVCTVGVTGVSNFNGAASFNYTVTANSVVSNSALASLTINNIDDAPVANAISPAAFNEEVESIITLSYSDGDSDLATVCAVTPDANVTETTACACDGAGVCTVGVTGVTDFNGAASFNYTVTANSVVSNSALASLTINNVDDAPVADAISPAAFNEEVESIITLSYSDGDSDLATVCAITPDANITETTACACDGSGVCTVGVTGVADFNGAASFNYTVTANSAVSNSALASLNINNVDDAPVANAVSPAAFNEEVESVITLSYSDADSDLATVCAITPDANVTETQACACDGAGVCTVGVTGVADFNGAASFNYTVTANSAVSNSALASLNINNVDDAPVANAISPAAFNEEVESVITLSYSDADSDLATVCAITPDANITETQACACDGAGVCTVGVTGVSNFNGAASFNYTVTANSVVSNSALASLTINNIDDAPVADAISPAGFNEEVESIITLSYSDGDSDLATVCAITPDANVTETTACACDGAGVCTVGVTGVSNFNGAASFNYTVTANSAISNSALASLTINNVDDAPVANAISPAAFNEEVESIITLSYTDADSDLATVCAITPDANITESQACACDGAGVCTVGVTGDANYVGAASFNYTVTANSVVSNSALASLTINNVDDAPVADDISPAAFNEEVESIITLSYSDADSDLATVCAITPDANVTETTSCACDGAGVCTVGVTGVADFNGAASFNYTVTANSAVSNSALASLTINNIDDAPVADDISPAAFNEEVESIITLSYSDADSDLATVCSVTPDANVTETTACACDGAGVCTVGVTGVSEYAGAASFNYTVTANSVVSNSALASLTISNIDDAPVADDISPAAFNEEVESIITLSYTDADSDLATACAITPDANITETQACACDGAGVCTVGVTGVSDFNGAASFNYTVTANSVVSNSALASLTINDVDDAPVANAISPLAFNEEIESIITLSYTDVDSDLATSCAITPDGNVTVTTACTCDGAGVCAVGVTGVSNFAGAASFNYTVTANSAVSNSALASLTINNIDDAPVADDISPAAFNEEVESIITLSYSDADSDLATACAITPDANITETQACACDGAGVCTVGVTGVSNYVGAASFNYTVTANSVVSNSALASLTINNTDDAPVADDISPAAFNEEVESIITLSYSDGDSDLATVCAITPDANITETQACACDGAGVCTVGVTGVTDFNGAASFNYTVTANSAVSNSALASLTINNVDDAPVANAISPASFNEEVESIITLSYSDADSDLATVCAITPDANITETQACACDGAGVCTVGVTGDANYVGAASFNYTVTANSVISNSALASLTISNIDDAPVADDISPAAFNEEVESIITLSYSDGDSDLATICAITPDANITETQACACDGAGVCTVGVTGVADFNGAASFNYTVTANSAVSNSALASLTINNVDDAPVANAISPAAFNEEVESIITLSYSDADSDLATVCAITPDANITETQACACDGAGVCTVGVTGVSEYNGAASFNYTVTANSVVSNSALASLTISNVDDAPVANAISPAAFNEEVESIITLSYTDADSDLATVCSITPDANITETQACACDGAGVCTVGVTGVADFNGAASFNYTVTANSAISNSALASLTINNTDDAPVADDISPAAFNEEVESIITLSYSDTESDLATVCAITPDANITETQACACDGAGVCTVGVTGVADFNGAASFNYTVTANSAISNSALASLTINNVDDAPVANAISPAAFNEEVESIITLSYSDADSDLAAICAITPDANITETQACACDGAGVCTVGVTGVSEYTGAASFNYTVTANSVVSNSALASLTINNTDDAPVADDISPAAFNEEVESIITLSYSDADSDLATVCAITPDANITETQACACDGAGVCTVGVTGVTDFNGAASFNYTVTANSVVSNSALASLTINNVDDAPVANAISPAAFNEEVESIITLSYSDADSDLATVCAITPDANITETQACACDGAGVCTVGVTGDANYVGAASFNYTVTANSVVSNSALASLTINNTDDAPVADDISPAAFNEEVESIITLSYSDADSDLATVCAITPDANITETQACACDGAGVCTVGVTGVADFNGAASFNYTVTANSAISNSALASLTINNTDDAPVADDISPAAFNEEVESIITLSYSDTESDLATVCAITPDANVTETTACACDGAGVCTVGVTGVTDFNGAASFNYTVTANSAVSNSALASLTINNVDDAPVADDISPAAFNEEVESIITLSYSDADSDLATVCAITPDANITETQACACDGAGVCTVGVTGVSEYTGAASFNYTVTANSVVSNSALASLTINNTDDAPVADDISPAAFNEEVESIITLSYSDADSDLATVCAITPDANITETQACACDGAGVCTVGVTGVSNFNGAASFNYTVTANSVVSNSALASLTINNVDDAPVANAISPAAFNEEVESIITLSYSDADSDLATVCAITPDANITETQACACDGAGVCTVGVTGDANYVGAASFNYIVTANSVVSNSALASLTITNVDDAPVANAISPAAFNEEVESIITLSYSDADSDLATVCAITPDANITETQACACDGAGVCTVGVTGVADFNGAASFNYTVTANSAISNSALASLTINNVDDAPVADDISPAAFNEEVESIITLSYSDADSDLATVCAITPDANITETQACACDGAGVCTVGVTGDANYVGAASFNYTVTANSVVSNSALASLTINNTDDAPVADDISPAAFNEEVESIITLSYSDADSDLATVCAITPDANITETQACACDGAGVCTVGVTGDADYVGAASFNYTVTANSAVSNSALASLTINNVDDAPVADAISPAAFNEEVESIITLSYSDADSDLATACAITPDANITETQACACDGAGVCTVGVTGVADFNGAASFNYTVTANSAVSNSALASLTINNVDDAPVANAISPAAFNEEVESIITLSYSDADSDLATVCAITPDANITETQACACDGAGVCTVGVTGDANYVGAASFNYTVTANSVVSNSALASLTISNVDDAPVANAISPAAFNEEVESIITLSYSDADSDLATVCAITPDANITETQACACDGAGVCTVGVTGVTDFNGAASFNYTVTANSAVSNSALASLTINNVDDAPVSDAISPAAFDEEVESIITLSYSDADSDLATVCAITPDANVTETTACACDGAGVCTVGVTGVTDFYGAASFNYTVTANSAVSNSALASLTIDNVDDAPVSSNLALAFVDEEVELISTLSYTDADGDLATSCSVTPHPSTTITSVCLCNGAGVCTVGVTGNLNYSGAADFTYTVTANSVVSNSSFADIVISNLDDAPVADAISPAAFNEEVESTITLSYTDNDGDLATACAVTPDANVTETTACACDGAGVCTVGVTGVTDFYGAAGFNYTVTANSVVSNVALASLTINNIDDAPVANAISPAAFNEEVESIITLSYSDADSDLATVCAVTPDANVTETTACACDGSGVCTVGVTGVADFNGAASFNYTVTANSVVSNSALASLTINNIDDAPLADAISPAAFDEDVESIITLSYSDADSDLATVCAITPDANITESTACACDGSGVCTVGVTGVANYFGVASFNYTVTANSVVSNSALASLTISSVDDAPVASSIGPPSFDQDTESIITLSYTDVEGDLATACSVGTDSGASVTTACSCDGAGVCTVGITGSTGYSGASKANYTVTANSAVSNMANISLTIDPVTPPVEIFRSVGVGNTTALETGSGNAMSITSGAATFATSLADNIGVGDVVYYDVGGTDKVAFIHSRVSSTSYTVRDKDGIVPSDIAGDTTWQIWRAYLRLTFAESGTVNPNIPAAAQSQVTGGNRDLVANNEIWNIVLYADGPDTSAVVIMGWTTSATNNLKIYTPVSSSEVGVSQRHKGVWDTSAYRMMGVDRGIRVTNSDLDLVIDGLQIYSAADSGGDSGIGLYNVSGGEITVKNNIVRGTIGNGFNTTGIGFAFASNSVSVLNIYNNIIYDINPGAGTPMGLVVSNVTTGTVNLYSNTIYNIQHRCLTTSTAGSATFNVKNNLLQNCGVGGTGTDMGGTFTTSENNLTEDASSPDAAYRNLTVTFASATNSDFRLSLADTNAAGQGADLSGDSNLAFTTDIKGDTRPASWSIGASEPMTQTETILFATSTSYSGSLGGLSGGDSKCQVRAEAGGLTDSSAYKAVLTTSTVNAIDHLTIVYPVKNTNGDTVESTDIWTNGGVEIAVDYDEFGAISGATDVWNGTSWYGTDAGAHCTDWTVTSGMGTFGSKSASGGSWIFTNATNCISPKAIYCMGPSFD